MAFTDFINWVLYTGGALIVASFLLERIARFQAQSSDAKWLISRGVAVVTALGLYALLKYLPADVLKEIDVYFKIASGVVLSGGVMQGYHALTKPEAKA